MLRALPDPTREHARPGPISSGLAPRLKRVLRSFGLRLGSFRVHEPRPVEYDPVPRVGRVGLPSIAVVTPSFDQAPYLARTIESVLGQGYPRLSYKVLDNASTDGSREILASIDDPRFSWVSRPDGGQADAINKGLEGSDAQVMGWLNADDLYTPGALLAAGAFLRDHPGVDVVYGHRIVIDEHDREVGRWILPRHRAGALLWRDYIPQETMLWRRSVWERAGGLDPSYRFALDWEFVVRLHALGARFARLPRFQGAFRTHRAQKSLAIRARVGEPEFERVRASIASSRLRARGGGAAYLAQSVGWTWAWHLGLLRAPTTIGR